MSLRTSLVVAVVATLLPAVTGCTSIVKDIVEEPVKENVTRPAIDEASRHGAIDFKTFSTAAASAPPVVFPLPASVLAAAAPAALLAATSEPPAED